MESIRSLETDLHSKTEEANAVEEKMAKIEEWIWKVMDQNREHAKTNSDLAETYGILKVENEQLQSKLQERRARFRVQEESFMLEKTHAVYSMQRKTLEDVKTGIENIDNYITEAPTRETTSFKNMPAQPFASSST